MGLAWMDDRKTLFPAQVISSEDPDPVGELVVQFLESLNNETPFLDYKSTLTIRKDGDFPKVAKDIFAFANRGGGWILMGWKQAKDRSYAPQGLPPDYDVDQASLQEKFNAVATAPLELGYREYDRTIEGQKRHFAVLYVPPSTEVLRPTKDGIYFQDKERTKYGFRKDVVYTRRGTQSIPATDEEILLLETRARHDLHRLSVLTGRPDQVEEVLVSNLFEITKVPDALYSVELLTENIPKPVRARCPFIKHRGLAWTFVDPVQTELNQYTTPSTMKGYSTEKWKRDPANRRIFHWIIAETIAQHCTGVDRNMDFRRGQRRLYYPLFGENQEFKVKWRGLTRSGTRKVAGSMYAEQFEQHIYRHDCLGIDLEEVGDRLYARLEPGMLLTWDGRKVIRDFRAGSVLTKLQFSKYNDSYLRDLYFWLEQVDNGGSEIVAADGTLRVSLRPLQVKTEVGIQTDVVSMEEVAKG